MYEWLRGLGPIEQALVAGGFTWALTAAGAATVFLRREMPDRLLDAMLGFAAGVMIAASFWSLLTPAIEMVEGTGVPSWLPAGIGFIAGAAFLRLADSLLPHIHPYHTGRAPEGKRSSLDRTTLLVLAITLHNIPEGLAVGVSFGAVAAGSDHASFAGALALAIGIAIQNVPEGIAVALPLRREGASAGKAFWYGQLSAAVEPVMAVIGAVAIVLVKPLLPYALGFAAGAMIFVVVEELIPEAQESGNADTATSALIAGFVVMMILDVGLG